MESTISKCDVTAENHYDLFNNLIYIFISYKLNLDLSQLAQSSVYYTCEQQCIATIK